MSKTGEEKGSHDSSSQSSLMDKWGTQQMGAPAPPAAHPHNQQAAQMPAPEQRYEHHPYLYSTPVEKPHGGSPMESILDTFNSWGKKAETVASNVWQHLKTGPSVSGTAWGKVSLTAKALTEGGFESLYKQTFQTHPWEKLKKTFACYLSTSTGPVAGTLYLSNVNVAFCSDLPLSFTAPSGQQTWSYYKVLIPLAKISTINPVIMRENTNERYIQIVTVDGHEFWFMGFVNYDKASANLSAVLSEFVASRVTG
ncbi:hypothetical protein H6P81_012412 [Aristolochia fimbriata]|uniref:GRAM domain-containing protein n=1 Tax=Aristolochia fimbriata TaxID=158543 RepID=A0AAV7EC40_ARIFI|nr:hypothetical protein H6P81_012412 [Aristolochia fimbriata]